MTKIWQRYILKEVFQVLFLFLLCFYGLYMVIDYASHASTFLQHNTRFAWDTLVVYYACEFIHRADVLIPFALLVATVRTLTKLNQTNELTALRAAGIPLKTLMRPLIFTGLLFTILLYANEQWLTPEGMNFYKHIQNRHSSKKRKAENQLAAEHLVLQDGSTLIFQDYDLSEGQFFDVYWVRSPEEIFRIKSLDPNENPPVGRHVDQLARNADRQLAVVSTEKERSFPGMVFNKKTLMETIVSPEDLSLSMLWEKWPQGNLIKSEKESQVVSALYRKLIAPWLCLMAVLAPIPLCVRFSRQIPVFFLYAINIFGLVAIYLILDSTQVLGKRQVLDPALVIWTPFVFFFSLFAWRFCRLR